MADQYPYGVLGTAMAPNGGVLGTYGRQSRAGVLDIPLYPMGGAPDPEMSARSAAKLDYLLNQSAPAQAIRAAIGGLSLPGDVYAGRVAPGSDEAIRRSTDLAGLMVLGGTAAPAGALGSGAVRRPLRENYNVPLGKYTSTLWRETSPSDARAAMPKSFVSGGSPYGSQEKYYADTPDLALGQGDNRGVLFEYDSKPFEGRVNTSKPTWAYSWENGQAEYKAAPAYGYSESSLRDYVKSVRIDTSILGAQDRIVKNNMEAMINKLKDEGWGVEADGNSITLRRPSDGKVTKGAAAALSALGALGATQHIADPQPMTEEEWRAYQAAGGV